MELLQLKYFKKVAETGKISTAAAALFISSPALSATISRLERELGAKLFDRHSNRIVLNENGEIFLRYVNQVFASLDSAKRELAEAAARRENEVHIGLVNGDIWREMLFYFTVAHPEIRLTTLSLGIGELQSLDLTGQTTFLFAMEGDVESSLWKAEALFEDRLMLGVHNRNPLSKNDTVSLEEMAAQRLYLPPRDRVLNRRVRALFAKANLPTDNVSECAEAVCRTFVEGNRGVIVSTRYADPDDDPGVRYIPIDAPDTRCQQMIYWDKNRNLRPEEQTLLDFAREFYRKHKHSVH